MKTNNTLSLAIKNHEAGRLGEAEAMYCAVLREQPANTVALSNLGIIANQVGKYHIAADLLRKSLAINPTHAATHNLLGNALIGLQRPEEAITSYRNALHYQPDFPEALYNIGVELGKLGRTAESITALNHVIRLRPNFPEGYNALGAAYDRQGKTALAIEAYQKAIGFNPNFALAYNNLGNTLLGMGMLDKALPCYEQALRHTPDFAEARFNMGNALGEMKRDLEAIDAFRAALATNPDWPEARFNLTKSLQNICDWRDARADANDFAGYMRRALGRVDPFFILSQNSTPADQLLCAQAFAARSAVAPEHRFSHTPKKSDKKIHIAYISGNFHQHPNSYLSVGLFEQHDRARFDVFGYSYGLNDGSEMRRRVEKSFDRFIDIQPFTHADAAKKIYDDGINILIDRQGYTTRHRMGILAYRPAPVQVNYLGYPGTMGADYIDYIIADSFVIPSDQQSFFIEKPVYLPDCYQSTDNRQEMTHRTRARSECGLPEEGFVFCCFNNTNKIRPEFFYIWMRLLHAVPGSVLWLLEKNTLVKENLHREAVAQGIDPARIVLAPHAMHADHLARHRLADLFLDTLPYNAHTTASDALWAGLPLLTCAGGTFAGRVAGSILQALHLPELITHTLSDYEALALKLAREPETLSRVRKKLEQNRLTAPLFDTSLYTRNMENAYMQMWERWQSGGKPEAIHMS